MITHLKKSKELAKDTYISNLARFVISKRSFNAIMLSLVIAIGTSLSSCVDDTNKPEELTTAKDSETSKVVTSKLVLKSTEIKEFKLDNQEVAATESSKYFGRRIQLNTPTELLFKNDSIFISKGESLTEAFKTKWQDKELYLYDDASQTWSYCGKKGDKSGFILNTGFYIKKTKDKLHTLNIIGQEYSLRTYTDLTNYLGEGTTSTSSITWLRTESLFE